MLALNSLSAMFDQRQPPWPTLAAWLVALIAITGALTTALGAARALPLTSPIPFSTALALLLLAGAWWMQMKRPLPALYLTLAATLLALDALAGYALERPGVFTHLFQGLSRQGQLSHLPDMAFSTAWAILLLSAALPAVSRGRPGGHLELAGIASASSTLGLAALALLTALAPQEVRLQWSDGSHTAASTAICLAALASTLLRRPRAPISSQRVVTRSMALAVPLLLAAALTAYLVVNTQASRRTIATLDAETEGAAAHLALELEALAMASRTLLRQSNQTDAESLDLLADVFPYVMRARHQTPPAKSAPMRFEPAQEGTRLIMWVSDQAGSALVLELVPQLLVERLPSTPHGARAALSINGKWLSDHPTEQHWLTGNPAAVPLPDTQLSLQFWYPHSSGTMTAAPAITVPALTAVAMLLAWLTAQSAILRSQSRELALFETTSEAILVTDENGVVESSNRPALALLDMSDTDLIGQPLKQLLPDLMFTNAPTGVAGTPANRQQLTIHKPAGGLLPVEAKVSEVRLRNSLFWVVALRDLSERQQLEQEIQARNTVFDIALRASPVGFVMTDADGCITEYNPAFAQWLGAGDVGLVGTPISAWVSPEHRPALMLACHRLRTGAIRTFTLPALGWRRGGPARWAKVSASGVFLGEGRPLDAISFKFIDTDAEQRLTRQLAETNQFLTAKNQELDQFAYIASHDLKEPLRTLRVYSDYLLKDLTAQRPDRVAQDAEFIRKAAVRMSGLIDDLLQLSRAGNAPLRCDTVSLNTCLEQALAALHAALNAAAAEVERPEHLPSVMGDEQQLTRVFINLIGNSIKFRSPDRPLRITIDSARVEQHWDISVTDNGVGIPPDKTQEVLAPFKRLHSQAEVEGSGIGLAIVNKIIERHGGSVRLASLPIGTAAFIRLPDNYQEANDDH